MTDLSKRRPQFHPMPGRLAVEPIEEEERYGGLFLPPSKEKATLGKIVALSGGYGVIRDDQLDLGLGDLVLFGANSGMAVEVGLGANRRKAIFLRESEVISKVTWEDVPPHSGIRTTTEFACLACHRDSYFFIIDENTIECPFCGYQLKQ